MADKHIMLNGDSRGSNGNGKKNGQIALGKRHSAGTLYKNLRIGQPVGTPTISKAKMVAAVRAVMKEDEMI